MRSTKLLFAIAFSLLLACAAPADAKSYAADRFDARIQVLEGGGIEVTETVVFRFDGTFTEVFRRIPRRKTDGIEILRASMDGQAFSEGERNGQYERTNKDGQAVVEWHFAPVTGGVHTFELTYVARGVVRQDSRGDLFAWRALPSQHKYDIAESTITIDLPAEPIADPDLRKNRARSAGVSLSGTQVTIEAADLGNNGWVEAWILLPAGSVIPAPPAWQQREIAGRALAPTFALVGAILLGLGLVLLFAARQGYDPPPHEPGSRPTGPSLPDTAPPAIAGALASNGSSTLEHAMATLFALADTGHVQIVEGPKKWGQRVFELVRTRGSRPLADYEEAVLDTAFTGRSIEDRVDLTKARSRIARRMKRFSGAVERHLRAEGLLDASRRGVRARFQAIAVASFVVALVTGVIAAVMTRDYGPWTLLMPAGALVLGIIALVMYSAHTPLSNEGLRRAREWRGFKKYMNEVTRDRATIPEGSSTRLLPFAVAVGLAYGWSNYLKKHRGGVPAWFRPADGAGVESFPYFVYAGGSGAGHGAGGAGAGGAAGGGASGAS